MSQTAPATTASAPGTTSAVDLRGLTRTFGGVRAVDDVSLRIERGEIVALLGPNGAGKTTTLDMLLGLSAPDSGSVKVLGTSARRAVGGGRIAAVLQTGGLLPDLTVAETVQVVAGLHGAKARIAETMQLAGLEEIARRRIGKCSGGEQQRVKFALALLPDPDVLVLDEPTAGMDVSARRRFWQTMRVSADAGRTVIFATHYLEEAEQFARRTVVMARGSIVADAATEQLRGQLGGRTVTATVPDPDALQQIADELRTEGASEVRVDADRFSARTEASDALAARLLEAGAHDLEITAPTLESAFTNLTEEES